MEQAADLPPLRHKGPNGVKQVSYRGQEGSDGPHCWGGRKKPEKSRARYARPPRTPETGKTGMGR